MTDLLNPDRILIGSSPTPAGRTAALVLSNVYTSWVDPLKILTVNVWSSELAKLVANAMLAQRISSINTISAICDQTGADIDEVATAIGRDSRLGSKFLKAGVGFGGSCFKKDILSLTYLARSLHLPEVAEYWASVLAINEFQMNRFTQRVVAKLNGALVGKKVTVLGFTFKQDTNDTRESPAIDVIKAVLSERPAEIAIFDPGCTPLEIRDTICSLASAVDSHVLKPHGPVEAYANAYDACFASSAILILTPWSQFRYPQVCEGVGANTPKAQGIKFDNFTTKDCWTQTDSLDLETYLRAKRENPATGESDDPLERLLDLPACPHDCQMCAEIRQPKILEAHANIVWALIASTMREPKWIFDGRNIVDSKAMAGLGFRVENLGRGSHI